MAAIITDEFRRNTTQALIDGIAAGIDKYYVGIGKSDYWAPRTTFDDVVPIPNGSVTERVEALMNLASLIQVVPSASRFVIPYVKASTDRRYKAYDPNDPTCFYASVNGSITTYPCYAMSGDNIYLCLTSYAQPVGALPTTGTYEIFTLGAYTWVLIAPLELASPFNTAQFSAVVRDPRLDEAIPLEIPANTKGRIYSIAITNPGSGYLPGDKVNLVGDGNEPDLRIEPAKVTIINGAITAIALPVTVLSGYTKASIAITRAIAAPGATDAVAIPLITPILGFGEDPVVTLPTWFAGLSVNVSEMLGSPGAEDAFLSTYRQISVIKNPVRVGDVGDAGPESMDALPYFLLSEVPSVTIAPSDGAIVTAAGFLNSDDVAAKAFLDAYKAVVIDEFNTEYRVYFHQNFSPLVNLKSFAADGTLSINGNEYIYTEIVQPEYTLGTGEMIFLENRKPIIRSASQTEELKIVIQF